MDPSDLEVIVDQVNSFTLLLIDVVRFVARFHDACAHTVEFFLSVQLCSCSRTVFCDRHFHSCSFSHRENGTFEVMSLLHPSITRDRCQLSTIDLKCV